MENDLKALKIDRSQRRRAPSASGPRTWLLVLAALLVGAVSAAVLFRFELVEGNPPAPGAVAAASDEPLVATVPEAPEAAPDAPVLIVSGYIVPHHRIEVGSKILGKISWVGVEKSDMVRQGQLLVKLDDREFRSQSDQAEARLQSAEARLAELEAGSRLEEVERASAELERSRVDLVNAELEYERLASLQESIVSRQLVDNAQARRDMASAALNVSEKNHRLSVLGPRPEQIESARGDVAQAAGAVRYWETQLAETEIRAPINGTVLERSAEVGEMVSTSFAGGAVVIALADLEDLQVEVEISQTEFRHISVDNDCLMSPAAYPDRDYLCEVAEIAPEANRQRATIQVKVQILEPDSFLRPEMDAKVTFYRPGTLQSIAGGSDERLREAERKNE